MAISSSKFSEVLTPNVTFDPTDPTTWALPPTGKVKLGFDNTFALGWIDDAGVFTPIGGGSSLLTTKGDLLTHSTVDVALPVGVTNGHVLTVDSAQPEGIKWAAAGGGGSLPPFLTFTAPPTSGWAWVNQGSGVLTSSPTAQYLRMPSQGAVNITGIVRNVPGATPYKVTTAVFHNWGDGGEAGYCFGFSDGTKYDIFRIGRASGSVAMWHDYWNTTTSISSVPNVRGDAQYVWRNPIWLRIQDDGTNIIMEYSVDGENFEVFNSHTRTTFLATAPTKVFVGAYVDSTDAAIVSLASYLES